MSEEQHIASEDNPSVIQYSRKDFLLTITLWLLFGTTFWVFLRPNGMSLLIFVIFCLIMRKLTLKWGTKLNTIVFPPPFERRLRRTVPYKIVALAMKEQWSACWIVFSVFPAAFLAEGLHSVEEPVLDLSEMKFTEAYIERIKLSQPGRRSSRKDYLYLIDKDNNKLKLYIYLRPNVKEKLTKIKEKHELVKVWSQRKIGMFSGKVLDAGMIWEIRHGDDVILEYNNQRVLRTRNFFRKSNVFISFYFIITIFFIYFSYRKKITMEGGYDRI
ncbi:MAG: hypothetical protein OEY01_16725 [Desulfobulbaceae bacterium]|nr:hypothetical protein [Desulfobulbaceae bacterium]